MECSVTWGSMNRTSWWKWSLWRCRKQDLGDVGGKALVVSCEVEKWIIWNYLRFEIISEVDNKQDQSGDRSSCLIELLPWWLWRVNITFTWLKVLTTIVVVVCLVETRPLTVVIVVLKEWADQGGALGFVEVCTKDGPWVFIPREDLGFFMFLLTCIPP